MNQTGRIPFQHLSLKAPHAGRASRKNRYFSRGGFQGNVQIRYEIAVGLGLSPGRVNIQQRTQTTADKTRRSNTGYL
jgi:hypothetical protein